MLSSRNTNKKLKLINKIGYTSYQFTVATGGLETAWRMYFYTTFCGISIVLATTLLTISKVITTIMTPIVGYISDNLYKTKFGKRFGRRKGLLLIGMPLRIITAPLYWIPNMPVAYYCIIMISMAFIGPLMSVSQTTFATEMSSNSAERAQLAGLNQASGAIVGIAGSLFLVKLFSMFGQNNSSTFFIAAIIYDCVQVLACVFFYLSVFERPVDESTVVVTREKPSLIKGFIKVVVNFKSAIQLKAYRQYLAMYMSEQMFRSMDGKINTYFIVFVLLLEPKSVSLSKSVGFVFGIMFLTFFIWLTAKTKGTFTYRIGGYASIVILLAFGYLGVFRPEHTQLYLLILTVAMNFGKTGLVNSIQFIYTFIPDLDEIVTGKRREGSYAGVNAFIDELFTTVEGILIGVILQFTGFVSNATTQPQSTINSLMVLYVIVPIILITIGIVISFKFKLTVENHQILEAEVDRLKSGGSKADVKEEVKVLVKELTGFDYERCWGNNTLINSNKEKQYV
ncbi:MFS transporter [Clostridium sp. SHJSY1]|uniref:MFS transporter n=1 Tax=Clostridium sp. SHJSY1 TaxID=2942483 RepID=UPI0028768120|nr:MFS transporter [Clostridium sp. SHJSY1]MDS0526298.1 MFS transporter [Clostridium sp. SHJSY1]